MAAREGWDAVGEYADEDESGWSGDRGPQLAAAIAHAEQLRRDEHDVVLVVQHSDRLARGDGRTARHLGELYFWALKASVEIRSVQDDSTFTNPLLAFAMGERNAEDSRRKSLAVQAGMKRISQAGRPSGGPRPYGYRYAKGALGIVEAEAVIVRRIFCEFLAGRSISAIVRGLHHDGVPTLRGGPWRQATVSGILRNPTYSGQVRYDGETFPGQHDPLIDAATWRKAQELLAARPQNGRGRPPKGSHLFRGGMLRCECGEAMVPRTNGGYQMYYCNGRHSLGRDFCDMPHLRRADIDQAVYRYFEQVALDIEATRRTIADARDRKLAEIRALHDQAEQEARLADERLARVRRDYTDGRISAEDWHEFRSELGAERNAARAEVERLGAQRRDVESWGELRDAEAGTLRRLSEIRALIAGEVRDAAGLDAVRAALTRVFDRFIVRRQAPRVHVELIVEPRLVIEPVVRDRAVDGYSENLRPILRREPLEQSDAENQRVGLPCLNARGPSYPPPSTRPSRTPGASSASATTSIGTYRRSASCRTSTTSRTPTRMRTGANDCSSGKPTVASAAPFARATRAAAVRASARYASRVRCRGFARPSTTAGSNSRGFASYIARAPASAARSAARCAPASLATPRATAPSTSTPTSRAARPPTSSSEACPQAHVTGERRSVPLGLDRRDACGLDTTPSIAALPARDYTRQRQFTRANVTTL